MREDQAGNAEFLSRLFKQELGNDSIDDEQYAARLARDERYQEVKDNLEEPGELKQVLEKDFRLPKFDQNEDPKAIKDQLLDLQEQEDQLARQQREEAQKRRQEIKDKYAKMIEHTSAQVDLVVGSRRFLVVLVNCIIMFQRLYRDAIRKRLKKRADTLEFIVKFYQIYNQVAISWTRRAIKRPLLSMYGIEAAGSNQPNEGPLPTEGEDNTAHELSKQSLRFFKPKLSKNNPQEFRKRLMLLRVRVKGILSNLLEATTLESIPGPLIVFIANLTKNGQFVPDHFLTPYELNRIDLDNYGAIVDLDPLQRQMIATIYLFGKILISKVLLPQKRDPDAQASKDDKKDEIQIYLDSVDDNLDEVVRDNFKIVASVLYLMFMQETHAAMRSYERTRDEPGNDIISKKLYQYGQLSQFFTQDRQQLEFVEEMKRNVRIWIKRIGVMVENSKKIEANIDDD